MLFPACVPDLAQAVDRSKNNVTGCYKICQILVAEVGTSVFFTMSTRTFLTILVDSAARYPNRAVFKIPILPIDDTKSREWKNITYTQFVEAIDLYARFWTHELIKSGLLPGTVIGLWYIHCFLTESTLTI